MLPSTEVGVRTPVSIICVFNSPDVLRECLTASVHSGLPAAPDTEYLPVDNTAGQFPSAGAALNHGARLAANDVVVFVHQDVFLHSLVALEAAAGLLMRDTSTGIAGATGVTRDGRQLGLIRDRVVFSGEPLSGLTDVDTLDEVLFMARRQQILRHPLAEVRDLSWHAYAVEYCVRMRSLGLRVSAAPIPLTHNSLSTNVDLLAEAHDWIAKAYPEQLPVVTTCGTVQARMKAPGVLARMVGTQKWRYRWLRESLAAHRLRNGAPADAPTVLGDIRWDIDSICSAADLAEAYVISAVPAGAGLSAISCAVELPRRNVTFRFETADQASLVPLVASQPLDRTVVVTNAGFAAVGEVAGALAGRKVLLGFDGDIGAWLLTGPGVDAAVAGYRGRRATPFAMRAG
ncbi:MULTISPECIES: glycosyltransferase [Micrococcaceae]|nr:MULTISPECIES: glycosyltransferase [Micrococcaceae]